ncbi:hypothetical protein C1E24_04510 [Pseudoalteromonas phenolica]|uniref:Uncharacterized protein n=1 Tax=Pseudoalteromonas phenolica TaxID=161398 RepID=A0A5R9Q719_9GAMM|nr:hypothetical protein C1E24_04510 [Pseudoalteromonas phenolica]
MYLHGVYVHINLLFEGSSVMKGAVGFQGETGGSLPLVVVANATKSQIVGKFQLSQLQSKQLISPFAKVTLLRKVYFARTKTTYSPLHLHKPPLLSSSQTLLSIGQYS